METDRFSHFISRVFATETLELECSQVQSLLPAFVEAELEAGDTGALGTAMHTHFCQCPDCDESYRALFYVVGCESEEGLPAVEAALEGRPECL